MAGLFVSYSSVDGLDAALRLADALVARPEVTIWLDHPKRARWHLHFTPTSSSWLTSSSGGSRN